MKARRFGFLLFPFAVGAAMVACGDNGTEPAPSILAGLNVVATGDSSPTSEPYTGSGYFRGTVIGQSLPGGGNDSLQTAPRIAGVTVRIYTPKDAGVIEPGIERGSTVTNAAGEFTLPTLPGGMYIVTFVPSANSGYQGAYAFGTIHANSSDHPWWVVLNKK